MNPTWLMSAISCILRHDLSTQLENLIKNDDLSRSEIGAASTLQFPVIAAKAANLLWRKGRKTKHAEEGILRCAGGHNLKVPLFDFLQELLIQFKVFVRINLNIDIKFGGRQLMLEHHTFNVMDGPTDQRFLFLLSLPGDDKPGTDIWSYNKKEIWKETLCHSIFFATVFLQA